METRRERIAVSLPGGAKGAGVQCTEEKVQPQTQAMTQNTLISSGEMSRDVEEGDAKGGNGSEGG